MNFIFFVVGCAVIGMSSYVLANRDAFGMDGAAQGILNTGALWAGVIFGASVLFVALAGCCGAAKGSGGCGKFFLFIYSFVVMVIIVAELAAGAVVLAQAGKLGALQKQDATKKVVGDFDKAVDAFVNKTYAECCKDHKLNDQDVVCKAIGAGLDTADANTNPCKDADTFRQDAIKFLQKYMQPIGIGMIVVAAIEVFCLFAACHVMCHARKEDPASAAYYDQQATAAQQGYQQQGYQAPKHTPQGGNLAYGRNSGDPMDAGSYA